MATPWINITDSEREMHAEIERLTAERDEFLPFLKDGESPIERLKREIGDVSVLMKLYAKVVEERDAALADRDAKLTALASQKPLGDGYTAQITTGGTGSTYKTHRIVVVGIPVYAAAGAAPMLEVNCDKCVHSHKSIDRHPCSTCVHGVNLTDNYVAAAPKEQL